MLCAAVMAAVTMALVPSFASAAVRFGARTLKPGMRGGDVRTLQRDLTTLGWRTRPTGAFTFWTTVHVKDFQRLNHIPADGVVGPETYGKLRTAMFAYEERSANQTAPAASNATANTTKPAALPAADSGGAGFVPANNSPSAPVTDATLNSNGIAVAPANAPQVIQQVIEAANKIAFDPYVYGGGHNGWGPQSGYDCSGSVSYALHGGHLLNGTPLDSTQFESYGSPGAGRWITIYSDSGHVWMTVAGLTFDTVNQSSANGNDRWSTTPADWETSQVKSGGYVVTHPAGW